MLIWIIFIISLVVATIITNTAQQLFMKVIGANVMFFSGKKKLIAIVVVALILSAIIIQIFGIEIPGRSAPVSGSSLNINNNALSSLPSNNSNNDASPTMEETITSSSNVSTPEEPDSVVSIANNSQIEVSGIVKKELQTHPGNGSQLIGYILTLDNPVEYINHDGDSSKQSEMHVFLELESYIDKRITVRGTTMDGHTAYHLRPVCLLDATVLDQQNSKGNSSALASPFDDVCSSLVSYYKSYLQVINQQDMSYLRNATPEQAELLRERAFGANKDYIFTFQQIIIDLDTVDFFKYEDMQVVEFYAAFQFSDEPRSGNGDKEHGANVQFIRMIYDEDLQNWTVAFSEIQSGVSIGNNQRLINNDAISNSMLNTPSSSASNTSNASKETPNNAASSSDYDYSAPLTEGEKAYGKLIVDIIKEDDKLIKRFYNAVAEDDIIGSIIIATEMANLFEPHYLLGGPPSKRFQLIYDYMDDAHGNARALSTQMNAAYQVSDPTMLYKADEYLKAHEQSLLSLMAEMDKLAQVQKGQ